MKKLSLVKLHKAYIQGTEEKAPIIPQTIRLCNLTSAVMKVLFLANPKTHLTTKMLKHLYDSKPAEEYEFILHNLVSIVKYPDRIYENKGGKRGQFGFVKNIKGHDYFCSFETTHVITEEEEKEEMNYVVTAFRIRKPSYIQNYKLLWSWKDDLPSS